MDAYWNNIRYNDAAALVLGMRPEADNNCLVMFFTDPIYRARSTSWERNAPQVVAQYRAAYSDRTHDDGFEEIVARAKRESDTFAELWERRDIALSGVMDKELEHPLVGPLFFESTSLRVPARPDLTLTLHTPREGTETAEKLQWLTSPEGRRGTMYPVAG
jgi:hypothetical protein